MNTDSLPYALDQRSPISDSGLRTSDLRPLVSICLPTLNARRFLEQRMESILTQTVTDWELIVCDSYSDDGSWEYLQQFKDDPRFRLYQVPREGLYAGWNECLKRCRGEYVYIATADDTMEPECLEKMVGSLQAAKTIDHRPQTTDLFLGTTKAQRHEGVSLQSCAQRSVDIAVCGFDVIDEGGEVLANHSAGRWPRQFYGEWVHVPHLRDGRTVFLLHAALGMIWWTMSAVVFRRSLLDKIGYFRTDRGSQADEEWEMRAALASDIVYLPEKLGTWRVSEQQATAKLPSMNRVNLDCLESVLLDPDSGIPQEWKAIPGWSEKISHLCRTEYQASLGLFGNVARREPKHFLRGVGKALRYEPRYLVRQCLRRLKWDENMSPDPIAYSHELIELFGTPWPPVRLGDWKH